jgi:hypothetical protein
VPGKCTFFKTIFGFSFLDIFKNVHFSKPNLLFGKNSESWGIIYIKKELKEIMLFLTLYYVLGNLII